MTIPITMTEPETMQAIQLLGASTEGGMPSIALKTLSIPSPTNPKDILIKISASAIHPSDLINARGRFTQTSFPRVPGRDWSGHIASGLHTGAMVYGTSGGTHAFSVDGFHAEYAVVSADSVAPKPLSLSFEQAACIGVPWTTAALTLRKADVQQQDVVLVLGAHGAVGSAVVGLARARRCKLLLATRDDLGDVNTTVDPQLQTIHTMTAGQGVDVVIDTVGDPTLTSSALCKLRRGGRLVMIAALRTGSPILGIEMVDFYRQEKMLIGVNSLLHTAEELALDLDTIGKAFDNGLLPIPPEWDHVRLGDAIDGYAKAGLTGKKVVFVME